VSYYVDYTMYLVAKDRDEASECAHAHLSEENESRFTDPDMAFRVVTNPVTDPDWDNTEPWGRCKYQSQYLKLNEVIALLNAPPPGSPPPGLQYDHLTELMPFVDSPPPLRMEENP
jgi:hypothetical protein